MAYNKKTWINRQTEYPGRRKLSPTGTENVFDVAREEGLEIEAGDPFDAATMNDLENRIEAGLSEVFATLTHSKTGTTHSLTGLPEGATRLTAKFDATADFAEGDTWTVGGEVYTASTQNGDPLTGEYFKAGAIGVQVEVDTAGKRLGFKSGGGLNDTLPPQVENIVVEPGDGQVTASWNGVLAEYADVLKDYVLVYKAGGIPTGVGDGTKIVVPHVVPTGVALSSLADGQSPALVKLPENGTNVIFLVLKHNYDSGRTLVLRKDLYDTRAWGSNNAYASSQIDAWLNGDYLDLLGAGIKGQIAEATIPYTVGGGNNTVSTISRKVFLLSGTEVDYKNTYIKIEGSKLEYFSDDGRRMAYLNGVASDWWLRSPYASGADVAWYASANGTGSSNYVTGTRGSRPAFTLPVDMLFSVEPDADGAYLPIL